MEYSEALRKGYVPGTGGAGGIYDQVLQSYAERNAAKEQSPSAKKQKQVRDASVGLASPKKVSGPAPGQLHRMVTQVPTAPNPANDLIAQMGSGPGSDPFGKKGGYKGFAIPQFQEGQAGQQEKQAFMQYFVDLLASKGNKPIGAGGRPHGDLEVLAQRAGYTMRPEDYMTSWDKNILAEKQAAAQASADRMAAANQQMLARQQQAREAFGLPAMQQQTAGTYAPPQVTTDATRDIQRLNTGPKPKTKQEQEAERQTMQRDMERWRQQAVQKSAIARRNASSTAMNRRNQGEPWSGYNVAMKNMLGQR